MLTADCVVHALRERGALWEIAPGLVGLRGDAGRLFHAIDRAIGALCRRLTSDEWRVPGGIDFGTLARAEYFASFPQWLTVAGHLRDDESALTALASSGEQGVSVRDAAAAPKVALAPAVCYHMYSALADQTISEPRLMTAACTCWRHEGARHAPLERGWAFTMRELVCVGAAPDVARFLADLTPQVTQFAVSLGLAPNVVVATDPFFAPTARGKLLLQRVKELKRELLLPIGHASGAVNTVAASSFNLHDTFFGDAFSIRLPDGEPATTGCVAFGIERWTLAFLARHGADRAHWPVEPLFFGDVP